jgi:hypothetical protein
MGIKSFIRNWLASDEKGQRNEVDRPVLVSEGRHELEGHTRFEVIECMNGRLVKCSTFKPNPHGPDWTHKLYVMSDGESVGDAVNLLLVTRG